MDKNHLGIGVIFSGKDDNFSATLQKVVGGATDAGKAFEKATTAAAGQDGKSGFFGKVAQGLRALSLVKIGSMVEDIRDALTGKGMGIDDVFADLDTMGAKLSQALDPRQAAAFQSQLIGVMKATAMTAQQTDEMAMGLMQYGRRLDDMKKSLPMMGKLVGVMGLQAGDVARLFGEAVINLNATPDQMEQLIKTTAKMQKSYKLTGLVEMLPDIFDSVTKNAVVYGKVQTSTAMQASLSVARLAGAFQKVGKSQSAALGAAKDMQNQFSEMNKNITGMQLGLGPLSDKTLKVMQYLTEAGFSDVQALKIIQQGQTDVAGAVKTIQDQLKTKDTKTQQRVAMGLSMEMGDSVGEAILGLRDSMQEAGVAADKEAEKLGSPTQVFDQMAGAMQGTVKWQEAATEAAKNYLDITTKFSVKSDYIKALQAQRAGWEGATKAVQDHDSWLGKIWQKFQLFKDAGISGLFPAAGELVPLFDMMGRLILPLTGIMTIFDLMGGWLGKIPGLWTGVFNVATKAVGFLAGALVNLGSIVWGVLVGGFQAFTAVLAATPVGWIIAAIVAVGAAIYLLVKYWDDVKEAMGAVWTGIVKGATWVWGFLSKIVKTWWAVTSAVVKGVFQIYSWVFGKIWDGAKFVWGKISEGFTWLWDTVKGGVVAFWEWGKGVFAKMGEWLKPVLDLMGTVGKTLMSPFMSIGDGIKSMFDKVSVWFQEAMDKIWNLMPDWLKTFLKMSSSAVGEWGNKLTGEVKKIWSGADAVAAVPGTVPVAAGTTPAPGEPKEATALKTQEGAPEKASLGADFVPSIKPNLKDKNFQAVVDSILDMKDTLAKLLVNVADRPVSVELRGDAKKFFNAANKQSANQAGQLGMAGAVGK